MFEVVLRPDRDNRQLATSQHSVPLWLTRVGFFVQAPITRAAARDLCYITTKEGLINSFPMIRITPLAGEWVETLALGTESPLFPPHSRPPAMPWTHVSRQVRNRSRTRNRLASAQGACP